MRVAVAAGIRVGIIRMGVVVAAGSRGRIVGMRIVEAPCSRVRTVGVRVVVIAADVGIAVIRPRSAVVAAALFPCAAPVRRRPLHPQGSCKGRIARMPAIVAGIHWSVGNGRGFVGVLERGCLYMAIALGKPLLRHRVVANATRTSAVGNMPVVANRVSLYDGAVNVGVMNKPFVHMHDCSVIDKVVTAPHAAYKADSHVAEAVIHTAVVTDVWSPIAGMEYIEPAGPAPIRRRPQSTFIGNRHPRTGYP